MFDEQQEAPADDRGETGKEGSNMPAPPGERASDEPVPATKGPDAGEAESSDSGEEDAVQDQAQKSASGETGAAQPAEGGTRSRQAALQPGEDVPIVAFGGDPFWLMVRAVAAL